MIVLVLLSLTAQACADDPAPNQKPNIVFIMADDLGPGWVDFDGSNDQINTPNLQQLAESGMVFTRAYAAASVCSPTRAACITGMSPAQIGLTTHIPGKAGRRHPPAKGGPVDAPSINALPLNLPSYARELKKQNYATGFLGKWHLAGEGSVDTQDGIVDGQYHPEHFGFDSNIAGCAYGQPKSWFDPFRNGTIADKTNGEYLTDRLGDEAAEFIKANKDQPFHLSLWFYSVHTPIKAPKEAVQRNGGNAYLAMLECMDNAVGKVLDTLDDAGVRDNTMIVFYSDNGGDKPASWLAEKKGSLLEGGLRVPMVVSWPGVITAGSQSAEPVTSMDFFPTFVHAAGGSTEEISQLEGTDLMPLFQGEHKLDRDYLFWHYPHNRKGVKYNMGSVVLSRDWKLYQGLGVVPDALFNLDSDSMEQDNVLSQNPKIAKRLRGELNQWLTNVNAKTVRPSGAKDVSAADSPGADNGKSKSPKEKYSWTLGYQPDRTVTFSQPEKGEPLKLDCFFPADHKAGGNNPCIILFFGGGWSGGDTSQFYGYSKYFASRGLVAISAQYRTRSSHKATPRNCVEDGKAAIRYVRSCAKEFGIDSNKIVVGGGSAGGHVAAACAMCPKIDASPESQVSSTPNALMLFNPVYDNGPDGYGHDRVKAYWRDISPMRNIAADLPPTISFFGDRDVHVPVTAINAFQQKMVDAGNQSETHIYEGQTHGFFHVSKGGRKMFEDVLTKADAFLVKNGFISGRDNVRAWTAETIANLPAKNEKKRKNGQRERSVPAADQSPVRVVAQTVGAATFSRTAVTGIGLEAKVSRRDPSDVIKVGDLYYVWYSRGPIKSGYNATVWYATSSNGNDWIERGQAIAKGDPGAWDEASVFTPNILVAERSTGCSTRRFQRTQRESLIPKSASRYQTSRTARGKSSTPIQY